MTRPLASETADLFPGARLFRGRRNQRGQRDPGRFPGVRHVRRDRRARGRRADACSRCCGGSGRRARASGRPSSSGFRTTPRPASYLHVPAVVMQWMFPAIIMLSAYLFLRGHDLPGGGFAAGVALAIGFLLQYLAAERALGRGPAAHPAGALDGGRAADRGGDRDGVVALRLSVPDRARALHRAPGVRQGAGGHRAPVRPRRLRAGGRGHRGGARRARPPVAALRPGAGRRGGPRGAARRARSRRRRRPDGARALARASGCLSRRASGCCCARAPSR